MNLIISSQPPPFVFILLLLKIHIIHASMKGRRGMTIRVHLVDDGMILIPKIFQNLRFL